MFFTKGKKIDSWLKTAAHSPFSELLAEYRSGQMKARLAELGLTSQEYHIDRLDDYRCIDLQARFGRLHVDIQIEPNAFTIAMDEDEPDDPAEFPLTSAEDFYRTLQTHLPETV